MAPHTTNLHNDRDIELSIIIPCLNEAETLAICISKAQLFFESSGVLGEIIVADNGSTDGSQEIARKAGVRLVAVSSRGYGAALLGGISVARGRFAIMGDADDSYDFSSVDPFLAALRGGADLVVGNRFQGGIRPGAMPFLHRYLGNPVLSFLGRLFFGVPIGDFHCGLRGFRLEAIREANLRTSGMEFASEMIVRSAMLGHRIAEVPTVLSKAGRSRAPHLRTWRDGWRHFKFLLIYSPRWLFLIPGFFFLSAGSLIAVSLFAAPVTVFDSVVFDLNTYIAGVFMIIVGAQLLLQWYISRLYAAVTGLFPRSLGVESRALNADRISLLGILFVLVGLLFFGWATLQWTSAGFGPLVDDRIPKIVVAGLGSLVLGIQTFFSALMYSLFWTPIHQHASQPKTIMLTDEPGEND